MEAYFLMPAPMRADQARQIPITTYLERSGIKPAKVTRGGRELWYSSPLREGDKTPSFKVDTDKNLWFDHGMARGGNVIDLMAALKKSLRQGGEEAPAKPAKPKGKGKKTA